MPYVPVTHGSTTHRTSNVQSSGALIVVGDAEVTRLGDEFLSDSGLTALHLTPLAHVTSVGHRFLTECVGLMTVDLTLAVRTVPWKRKT